MNKRIWTLFLTFLKIGAFTFGGGYAMIPLIQSEIVEKNGWMTDDDILDIIAIAESTPGPIAINSATFVGYKVAGFFGAFFATLGVVMPSFLIILIIGSLLREFQENKLVQYAFFGIRAGVVALVVKAWFTMYKKCEKTAVAYAIAVLAFVAVAVFDFKVIYVLTACALFGLAASLLTARRGEKK